MARFVFFSFHYQRDIWRVNQVRNAWRTQGNQAAGYIDAASFEQVRRRGHRAVCDWIDEQLNGTTVTAVLIGQETASRDYVQYEIEESARRGNGFVGIHIHDLLDQHSERDWFRGHNPLDDYEEDSSSWLYTSTLADRYRTYDWVGDDGYRNFGDWVEDAYQRSRE